MKSVAFGRSLILLMALCAMPSIATIGPMSSEECHRDGCLKEFDVVLAPAATTIFNPGQSGTFIIFGDGQGPQVNGVNVIPQGTHFLGKGLVFPGGTFDKSGPFVSGPGGAIRNLQEQIGLWNCNGALITDTTFVVGSAAESNIYIANSTVSFHFNDVDGRPAIDHSAFILDTFKTINYSAAIRGSGKPARLTKGAVVGGIGQCGPLLGETRITTYVDEFGAVLFRFSFSEPVKYR